MPNTLAKYLFARVTPEDIFAKNESLAQNEPFAENGSLDKNKLFESCVTTMKRFHYKLLMVALKVVFKFAKE